MALSLEKLKWALNTVNQTVVFVDENGDPTGDAGGVTNKSEPTPQVKLSGLLYDEPMPREWLNFLLYQIYEGFLDLDSRSGTGSGTVLVTPVTSPHIVSQSESKSFLLFDSASDVTLQIPDGLSVGTTLSTVNIGAGGLTITTTSETFRGVPTVTDPNGYLLVTKLTSTLWQVSEHV